MAETRPFTIEAPDGSTETIDLPEGFTDLFAEPDESPAAVLADIALLAAAQQVHGIVHHGGGGADEATVEIEASVLEEFESRFGQTFAEMTGHGH